MMTSGEPRLVPASRLEAQPIGDSVITDDGKYAIGIARLEFPQRQLAHSQPEGP